MKLSEEQQQSLRNWVSEGLSLADIQRKTQSEWGENLTYMEVRFLVDDVGADLPKAPKEAPKQETPEAPVLMDDAGGVDVSVDAITRPGAMVSGQVTFPDGENCVWQLDQMGRIGLIPQTEGYQPSAEAVEAFQGSLRDVLQKKGFA